MDILLSVNFATGGLVQVRRVHNKKDVSEFLEQYRQDKINAGTSENMEAFRLSPGKLEVLA